MLWLWHRLVATAPIRPLVWEPPYATGSSPRKGKKTKKKKMWWIHTKKYYSALKRKEILTYSITWMNYEDIMGGKISQSQKGKYCIIQ